MEFEIVAKHGHARTAIMKLPHYQCELPMFMPVGTRGSVKGLTSHQLQELQCQTILGNTYHLQSRPGCEIVEKLGGLHNFVNWPRGMLTDSGGFQMVSLLKLAEIREEGVEFRSPIDGSPMLLTPEDSIRIQNALGADVIMALDDVVPAASHDSSRFEEATYRTTRWLDRCLNAHRRPKDQNLFAIIQGGLDLRLREISLNQLIQRDCPGYAIGGLAGGEDKNIFWRIVEFCTQRLPINKPRYVMGIGYPLDIVVCSALGADMYDSVYPTRTARFGVGLTSHGPIRLKNAAHASDSRPLDEMCSCKVCQQMTRATLHALMISNTVIGARFVTYHNVAYMMTLTRQIRESLKENRFSEFVMDFLKRQYSNFEAVPDWAKDALNSAGVRLTPF